MSTHPVKGTSRGVGYTLTLNMPEGTATKPPHRPPFAFEASARFNAQRFFVAAMIAFLPAAESFRLGLEATSDAAPSAAFLAAHLFRCASAIRFLPAALTFRRLRPGSGVAAGPALPPVNRCRISDMCASMRCF
jgi:hypothetical protein